MKGAIKHLTNHVSQLLARYEAGSARMEDFMAQTDANFTVLRAATREDVAALSNTLGDRIDSLRNNTSGRPNTLDSYLTNMEEHDLAINRSLSMLETKINQNNQEINQNIQEIVLARQHLAAVDKSLISVHKKVKDLDSDSTDLNKRMQDEFATIYTRLTEVQRDLKEDSDSKIASLQSDIDALTGSINARIANEMDAVLTAMERKL